MRRRFVSPLAAALALSAAVALQGCGRSSTGTHPKIPDAGVAADAGSSTGGTPDAGPCADIDAQTDPQNCGACGHACARPSCLAGLCGCLADADCASGERCSQDGVCISAIDLCAGVQCAPGTVCRVDPSCDGGQCGACQVEPCATDAACEAGEHCDPHAGICRWPADPCLTANCSAGAVCREGACQVLPCGSDGGTGDAQCGLGERCVGGVCRAGQLCGGGPCVACTGDGQCAKGQACINGLCGTCVDSTQCEPGEVCRAGACGACTGDPQCNAPQTCGGGGTPGLCGCTKATCAGLGSACGLYPDGCGGAISCGVCPTRLTCDQGVCKLPAPSWLAPTDGTVLPMGPIDFDWSDVPGASGYRLQLYRYGGTSWSSAAAPNDKLDTTASSAPQVDLTSNGSGFYAAELWASGADGGYGVPAPLKFALFPNPGQATGLAPGGWTAQAVDPPTLSWSPPAGMCGYQATIFRWDAAQSSWTQVASHRASDGATAYTPPRALGPGIYYWTIQLGTAGGWGSAAGEGFEL